MATSANGSISWETDIAEWACQGLGISQTLFSSLVHPTPTLQIKELKVSEAPWLPMLLAQETVAFKCLCPPIIPQYLRKRGSEVSLVLCELGKVTNPL